MIPPKEVKSGDAVVTICTRYRSHWQRNLLPAPRNLILTINKRGKSSGINVVEEDIYKEAAEAIGEYDRLITSTGIKVANN